MAWWSRFDDFNDFNVNSEGLQSQSGPSRIFYNSNNSANKKYEPSRVNQVPPPPNRPNDASFKSRNVLSYPNGRAGYSKIGDITLKMSSVSIVGVIILKEAPKSIIGKKGNGTERHLLALTVCDAPMCFVNVTCWGSGEFVGLLASEFNIGDVVDITGAQLQAKSSNSSDEKFKPWTPCPCHLNVSDNQGTIAPYSGPDSPQYMQLVHQPTRANNDFYTLEDIEANGMNLHGEHINILAAVKKVWPKRDIVTKLGKKTKKVDIVVCDETCQSFQLTLWDHFVEVAETWVPFETVIFAADAKITFNEFRSTMVSSSSSRTLITVNPDTPAAHSLRQFVQDQSSFLVPEDGLGDNKDPDIESITNFMNVREAKIYEKEVSVSGQPGYATLYAFLSHFDVDGDVRSLLKVVCTSCRRRVYESSSYTCPHPSCGRDTGRVSNLTELEYNITVNVTDHTGTLESCHLAPSVAEQMFGCKASQFQDLSGEERLKVKWSLLLERVKAVIKIRKLETSQDKNCYVHLLALSKADPAEVLEHGFRRA